MNELSHDWSAFGTALRLYLGSVKTDLSWSSVPKHPHPQFYLQCGEIVPLYFLP